MKEIRTETKIAVLDIGGTSIKSGLFINGQLFEKREEPTEAKSGGNYVMEKAIGILKAITNNYEGVERIGISTAGQVDSSKGLIKYANSNIPNYTGMKVKDRIEEIFHVPVTVENDVNSAAIGEAYYGAGKDEHDFLCLTYGTGVGGAIIVQKKIYHGSNFSAGEFGGILVHPEERNEEDKFSGCYERYASATALVEKVKNVDSACINGRKIFEKINERKIQKEVNQWCREITYGLVTLTHIFNPSAIILGGGVMEQNYVLEKVKETLYNNIIESFHNVKIKQAELGNQAGLLGAAVLALQEK